VLVRTAEKIYFALRLCVCEWKSNARPNGVFFSPKVHCEAFSHRPCPYVRYGSCELPVAPFSSLVHQYTQIQRSCWRSSCCSFSTLLVWFSGAIYSVACLNESGVQGVDLRSAHGIHLLRRLAEKWGKNRCPNGACVLNTILGVFSQDTRKFARMKGNQKTRKETPTTTCMLSYQRSQAAGSNVNPAPKEHEAHH